jgi:biopolymer transport protein ExbB
MIEELIQFSAKFMQEGGVFMWVIFVGWAIAMAISVERYMALWVYDIDAPSLMNEIQRYVLSGDIQGAIKICAGSRALLPRILKNGLKRANKSETQIQNAVDATSLEVLPRLESRLNYLSLLANISTLLGLLGTIQGLIVSFGAVSAADPSQKAQLLARGIALAMNTTALGLVCAISIMILHTFLVNKADRIVNGIDEYSVKLIDLLGTRNDERR